MESKARACGQSGLDWLARLPAMIAAAEIRWGLSIDDAFPDSSTAFVAPARDQQGRELAIKIAIPAMSGTTAEIAILRRGGGRGYVGLVHHDADLSALVTERLGPALSEHGLPVEDQIRLVCAPLQAAWSVPADGIDVLTGDLKATALAAFIQAQWAESARHCDRRVLHQALRYTATRRRAFDPTACVLAHGDPHPGNALRDRRRDHLAFLLVDPEGLFIEPAYDLGVFWRDWSAELLVGATDALARHWCGMLAAETGVDAESVWQWGFVERVSTGLYLASLGELEIAGRMLRVAGRLIDR